MGPERAANAMWPLVPTSLNLLLRSLQWETTLPPGPGFPAPPRRTRHAHGGWRLAGD